VNKPAILGGAPVLDRSQHRVWPIIGDEEKRAVMRVLDRGIMQGVHAPETRALEDEFAAFVGAKRCLLTHCGTSALQLALVAAGVGEGDEVIVPAYSFVATPLCVALQGATPVFVDVDPETGHMDPALARAAITRRTKAVMPVHIHGEACDLGALLALGLPVVEDAAQAHGAEYKGQRVGAIGVSGGFSLQGSKNLCAGEGGLFVTNDERAAEHANQVRNFGLDLHDSDGFDPARPLDGSRALESLGMGSMFRGNEMAAAFCRAQLERLPELTTSLQRNGERLARKLSELPGVHPPRSLAAAGRTTVHHKYRVRFDPKAAGLDVPPRVLRDAMKKALIAEGLEVVYWQSAPLPAQPVFQKRAEHPFRGLEGGTDLAKNYDPRAYPRTAALLDSSLVLFSQSCPLIAQSESVVDRYAEAFARVWHHREAIVAA
jgi:perosamine synthetase